jgi:prepilin-type N-terminal cleavage/methylation domain-containing protein
MVVGFSPSRTIQRGRIKNQSGFSLIELMVATAIFAVLTAIATPNVIAWRNNAQFSAAVREVKVAIEGVRMAAIKTNLPADLLFDGTNVFNTQTQTIVAGVPVPKAVVVHRLAPGITIAWNNGPQLTFNNRGMPLGGIGGTVTIRHVNGLMRRIVVTMVGSSRIQ